MTGTWVEGWEEKLAALEIRAGGHQKREEGVCVMEAARAALKPTVVQLQDSASDLVRRMAAEP